MAMAVHMRVMDMGGSAHHNSSTIHSGHYMMSCLDETSDDTDYYAYTTETEPEYQHNKQQQQRQEQSFVKQESSNSSSVRSTDPRISCFIENNLAELLQYMTLTYNGTLPSPKWKDFKGIKLKLRQKIRLNNIIWREWHMQYIKFKNPVVCQFDVPTSDRTHNKPEAVVLEGKYCKRRLESLAVEYNRWRLYAKQNRRLIKNEEDMQKKLLRDNGHLDSFMSLIQSFADEVVQAEMGPDNKKLNFKNDHLFTSLAQPFAFPCVKEIAAEARNYFSTEMIVQPGLIQLQPNLPENLVSYEMKASKPLENCQKVNRRNPILSSLLMGSSSSLSSISGLVAEKPPLMSTVANSSLPLLSNQLQVMAAKSSNLFLPLPELSMPFNHFSNQNCSVADDVSYLPSSSSPISMTFFQQDLQTEISAICFGTPGFSSLSYPVAPPSSTPPSQTNHLRALLQGTNDYKFQKDETLPGTMSSHSNPSVFPLPNKRRKSTGQPIQNASSLQACNKNIQRVIDSDGQDRSCRRASTGTLSSTGTMMSSDSEIFAVPQKVQKLKSHSVGSQPSHGSPQMTVRRRKTSCVARGPCQVNYLHEVTGVQDGGSSIKGHMTGSPVIGVSCHEVPGLVSDVDQSALWDLSLMPPIQSNCHFEPEQLDCEMSNSSSNSMTASQLVSSAVCGIGNMGRASNSMSVTAGTVLQQCCAEDFGSPTDELSGFRMRPELEYDRQQQQPQQQQHVEQRRVLHLSSEQKRRVSINSGFERLEELVRSSGEKPSSKSSKSATLHKSALFIKNMQNDRVKLHSEMESLKKEMQLLQDDLSLLQSNLPVTGCLPAIRPKMEVMCDMYNDYVRARTHSDWKFWIFGQLMRPIYESYIHSLSSVFVSNLGQAIKYWLDQHCSLAILRPAISNELREICKKTSLINNPSKLPQEALAAAGRPVIYKPD